MPQLKETKEELGLLNLIQQFLDTITPGGYVLLAQTAPGEGPGTSRTALVCNLPPADAVELMEEFSKQFRESLSVQQAGSSGGADGSPASTSRPQGNTD